MPLTEASREAPTNETPGMVKRATETTPENPENILLSAKLTRNAKGLTLMLRSPILEQFFRVLSSGVTTTAGTTKRWRIPNPTILNPNPDNLSQRWVFPSSAYTTWLLDGGCVNLQLLTTCGLESGVNLISDTPMTKEAMREFLENLKLAAREIYLSFCTPVEGEINLLVTERLSTGQHEINDR